MGSYLDKRIRRLVGKAICDFDLIRDGDRVLVGLSGGKDSLVLLKILAERRKVVPTRYELRAVTVDLGFGGLDLERLRDFASQHDCELIVKSTQIGLRAHRDDNPEVPCFMCSRMRRKVLFQTASELGCNKLALGHTKDDIIVTFFMNILYSGEISTMVPRQELFGGKLTIIRPLALVDEDKVAAFARQHRLPVMEEGCPTRGRTKRAEVKAWLQELFRRDRRIKGNVFHALGNVKREYLMDGRRDGV